MTTAITAVASLSALLSAVTALVAALNHKKLGTVHVLVNGRLAAAQADAARLREMLAERGQPSGKG